MIVTFYSSKGGCGKTSSALALLSAIAEKNHTSSLAEKIRVAAVDVDPQGSLSNFARERAARGLPSHGISHYSKQAATDAADEIKELARENDLVIVDTQGAYSGAARSHDQLRLQCRAWRLFVLHASEKAQCGRLRGRRCRVWALEQGGRQGSEWPDAA